MAGRSVVGVDGTHESVAALRWAPVEAALRSARVEVVHACHYPCGAYGELTGLAAASITQEDMEVAGRAILDRSLAAGYAAAVAPGVEVEPMLVEGAAAGVRLEAAVGADLLVVGSRGHGGFAGLLLGSVSQHCSHHAPCPVVIVPPGD